MGGMVRIPIGGMSWHYLHYVLGLDKMGIDVYYFEDSGDEPLCYDPSRYLTDTDPSYGVEYTRAVFEAIGLEDRWGYYDAHSDRWLGPQGAGFKKVVSDADVFLNLAAFCPVRSWLDRVPLRVFIDTDPLFEQVRQLTEDGRQERTAQHNRFLTFGENIPGGKSKVPDDGVPWIATRQPISLDHWPAVELPAGGKYTTVMVWDSYPPKSYDGREYGSKSASFGDFLDVPANVPATIELALGSEHAPRDLLLARGWLLRDPLEVSLDPWAYRDYIVASRAEFSVAKHGYVVSNSGWFSERSACYLASGRPVVTQETGFADNIPTGRGLFSFSDLQSAVEAIGNVEGDYQHHSRWARELAQEAFASDVVLSDLLHKIGL